MNFERERFFEKERMRREIRAELKAELEPTRAKHTALLYPTLSLFICKLSAYAAAVDIIVRNIVAERSGTDLFTREDVLARARLWGLSQRSAKRGLKEGIEIGLWSYQKEYKKPYRLISRSKVMAAMGLRGVGPQKKMDCRAFEDSMRVFWRHLYNAFLAENDGEWHRETLISITGKSKSSLIRAEKALGIKTSPNFVITELSDQPEIIDEFNQQAGPWKFYAILNPDGSQARRRNGELAHYAIDNYRDAKRHARGIRGRVVLVAQINNTYRPESYAGRYVSGRGFWLKRESKRLLCEDPQAEELCRFPRSYLFVNDYITKHRGKHLRMRTARIYIKAHREGVFWKFEPAEQTLNDCASRALVLLSS